MWLRLAGLWPVFMRLTCRGAWQGPWTSKPNVFDNQYFKDLLEIEWKPQDASIGAQFSSLNITPNRQTIIIS
jgi:catalase (peroxidase I)